MGQRPTAQNYDGLPNKSLVEPQNLFHQFTAKDELQVVT